MRRTITAMLAVALAVGMLVSLTGTAAAQGSTDLLLQADDFGPLLELITSLFDISISIEG